MRRWIVGNKHNYSCCYKEFATIKIADKRFWAGIGISLLFLYLLLSKIDIYQLSAAFREMNFWYVLIAVMITFLGYYLRAIRWRYILAAQKKCLVSNLFTTTLIGFMMNGILPARLGELARAYLLAEKENLEKGAVFASLVLDRLYDGFAVLIILAATLLTLHLPHEGGFGTATLMAGGGATLAIYLGAILFLVFLKRRTANTIKFVSGITGYLSIKLKQRIVNLLDSFIKGVHFPEKKTHLCILILLSVIIWFLAIVVNDLVLRSFGLILPLNASMLILVSLVFALMVPASPGYVGTYHYACFMALKVFNVVEGKALSIALMIHAVNFLPVIIAGFICLWRNNLSVGSIQYEDEKAIDPA